MAEWICGEKTSPLGYQYLDVVHRKELIRCKDCKYYMDGWCPEIGLVNIEADWFCGYGEEKHGHPERNLPDHQAGDGVPGGDDSVLDRSALD